MRVQPLPLILGALPVVLAPTATWALFGPGSWRPADVCGAGPGGRIISLTVAAGRAAARAAAIFFGGGTATPLVPSVGTFSGNLAGLAGIAATNYGLAMLGGGAI